MSAELDPEWVAFRAGLKPALRLLGAAEALREVEARARRGGLGVARALLPGGDRVALYLARSQAEAQALREAEAPILPGLPPHAPDAEVREAHATLGRLLGFPPCCVEAFLERLAHGVHRRADGSRASERFVAAEEARRRSSRLYGRLNFLLRAEKAYLSPFDPCRFDCALGLRYAGAVFEALRARDEDRAQALRERLMAPVRLSAGEAEGEGEASLSLDFEAF